MKKILVIAIIALSVFGFAFVYANTVKGTNKSVTESVCDTTHSNHGQHKCDTTACAHKNQNCQHHKENKTGDCHKNKE